MNILIELLTVLVVAGVAVGTTATVGPRARRPPNDQNARAGDTATSRGRRAPDDRGVAGDHRRRWSFGVGAGERSRRRQQAAAHVVLVLAGVVAVGPALTIGAVLAVAAARRLAAHRTRQRAKAELDALVPELIDLMLVGIHAGLTPANAVLRLRPIAPEPLKPALLAVEHRVRSGDRFADSFHELVRHAGPPYQALVGAVALAERTGDPIGPVLDRLAEDARRHRRRLADASARELPVRLSVPLVTCTLPAFILLTIAPVLSGALSSLRGAVP